MGKEKKGEIINDKDRQKKNKKNKNREKINQLVKNQRVQEDNDVTVSNGEFLKQFKVKAVSTESNLLPDAGVIASSGSEIKREKKRKFSSVQVKMSADVSEVSAVAEVDEVVETKGAKNQISNEKTNESSQNQFIEVCDENVELEHVQVSKKRKKKKKKGQGKNEPQNSFILCMNGELSNTQAENVVIRRTYASDNEVEFTNCNIVKDNATKKSNDGTKRRKQNREEISSSMEIVVNDDDNNCITEDHKKSAKKKKKSRKEDNYECNDSVNDKQNRATDELDSEQVKKFRKANESENKADVTSGDKGKDKVMTKSKDRRKKKKRKREEMSNVMESAVKSGHNDCLTDDKESFAKKKKKSKKKDRTVDEIAENKPKKSKKNLEQTDKKDETLECQWQSAEFGDTAQKEKFLRLMGAYKTSSKKSTAGHYSVMAMNKQQEERLSNSLEKQFLRAMQTRKERGVGLGYQ